MPVIERKDCSFIIGAETSSRGSVYLDIRTEFKECPRRVQACDVYMEIICEELNIGKKLVHKQKDHGFIIMTLMASEFKRHKTITFRVYLEVLAVFKRDLAPVCFRRIQLSSRVLYQWQICDEKLQRMKRGYLEGARNVVQSQNVNEFCSPNFGLVGDSHGHDIGWYLEFHPCTHDAEGPMMGSLCLKHLYFPPGVG